MKLQLYHLQPSIHTLGPGERFGIWVQGCGMGCEGCLVPQSHDKDSGFLVHVDELCQRVCNASCEGVSISGGEPFDQHEAVLKFLEVLKSKAPYLSVMIYSGYTLEQLRALKRTALLKYVDILIDGKYEQDKTVADPWRGSSNQGIHFLTKRYGTKDYIKAAQTGGVELHLDNNGVLFQSGVPSKNSQFRFEFIRNAVLAGTKTTKGIV